MTRQHYNHLLQQFGQWAIDTHRSTMGDLDGGSIQDKLEALGLLKRVVVTGPCGDDCRCVEYTDEWPTDCVRLVTVKES